MKTVTTLFSADGMSRTFNEIAFFAFQSVINQLGLPITSQPHFTFFITSFGYTANIRQQFNSKVTIVTDGCIK